MGRLKDKGAKNVKVSGGGNYFKPGKFHVEIKAVKFVRAQDGVDTFVIETKVLESSNPEVEQGSTRSQAIKLAPPFIETKMADVWQFLGASQGIEDVNNYKPDDGMSKEDFFDQLAELVTEDDQPLAGLIMELECYNRPTKQGNDFTKHVWGDVLKEAA